MKKIALIITLCCAASTANAASSLHEICTDYVKYLGHAYGYATSEDTSMRKLLQADIKNLSLSEAMVQKEMYKAITDEAAKMYYSMFLNPDLNETNRGAFAQMVSYCETGPDMMIPSWPVLVAKGKVKKEDAGKSINSYIQSEEFQNSRSMRHQQVEGSLMERARGLGTNSIRGNLSPADLQKYNEQRERFRQEADKKLEEQKNGSLNSVQKSLKSLNLPYEW
ncbi:hypothetical protein ICL29_004016 [Salmonella enterica]|nr:hypothetical protein [Salmonella enterica]EHK5999293.1 hypothetical protein [Salmonella enterica]EIF5124631.1 hypothetical protein [Salmonella enterica]EIF5348688.1 hypothetical protein [Salmonella enterica]EIF5657285.1 hypothetical protein [Salmonella enterica]